MKNLTNGLPAIHPDELLHEIVDEPVPMPLALADPLGVSPMRVSHLLKGQRPVTAELALRLGLALGQTPQYWLKLQAAYDLKVAQVALKDSLLAVRALAVARRMVPATGKPPRTAWGNSCAGG